MLRRLIEFLWAMRYVVCGAVYGCVTFVRHYATHRISLAPTPHFRLVTPQLARRFWRGRGARGRCLDTYTHIGLDAATPRAPRTVLSRSQDGVWQRNRKSPQSVAMQFESRVHLPNPKPEAHWRTLFATRANAQWKLELHVASSTTGRAREYRQLECRNIYPSQSERLVGTHSRHEEPTGAGTECGVTAIGHPRHPNGRAGVDHALCTRHSARTTCAEHHHIPIALVDSHARSARLLHEAPLIPPPLRLMPAPMPAPMPTPSPRLDPSAPPGWRRPMELKFSRSSRTSR